MLNQLKKRPFGDKVKIIKGDFFEVDFEGPYDAVISTSALHHFPKNEKIKLYKKIWESLKSNGVFVNSDKIASSIEEEQKLLDDYYKYVEGEKGERRALYIIISMREDVEDELLKHSSVHKDKYKVVFYREFVAKLKQNLGEYVASCNAKYLAILTDFIQFLDRKGGRMSNFTPEEIAFFIDNNASLETLINRRNEFVKEIEKIQHSRLEEIKELLKKKEPNDEWWIYANTDLGITIKEGIGLESGFDIKGRYNIQITIWQPYKWPEILENYRGELIKLHGRSSYNCDNTKWELKFDPLGENTSPEEIAEKLYSMCRQLNEIVKSVNK